LSSNPDNDVYYMNGPDGLFNLEQIYSGAPIWLSYPHFYNADPKVKSAFAENSFSASKADHYPYAEVEPLTGLVFRFKNRYQLNLKLSKVDWFSEPGYSALFDDKEYFYAPIFWVEESYEIPTKRASLLHDGIIMTRKNGLRDSILLGVFGSILVLFSFYSYYRFKHIPKNSIKMRSDPVMESSPA
jgi:hypothetical protein